MNNLFTLLLLLSVFISAVSQILLKKSALEEHKSFIFEYLNFKVILAYFLFFFFFFIDLFALKKVPLCFVPVVETSSYIFIIILSRIIFKEKISKIQIAGIILVISGILIYII